MKKLNEDSLVAGDLRNLVDHIFEIDNYRSKMGDDKDVVVLSFTVESKEPAQDLISFIEKGYQFVLDADMSPGELSNGKYLVFVELERNKDIAENISNLLYGLEKLTDNKNFKFRYHKSFNSVDAVKEKLEEFIPTTPRDYETKLQEKTLENYDVFFNKSMLESIKSQSNILEFKKIYADPLKFKIIKFGQTKEILESIEEKISMGWNDMAEIMFLTKYVGNYNITKIGNNFIFENQGHSIIMEKL
jgi:hypothetical protein